MNAPFVVRFCWLIPLARGQDTMPVNGLPHFLKISLQLHIRSSAKGSSAVFFFHANQVHGNVKTSLIY